MKKLFYRPILLLCMISGIFLVSCGANKQVMRMQKLEEGVSNPVTIDELKEAISKYEDRIRDIQLAQNQVGIWYKILGTRYLDNKMYGEALEAFQKALQIHPANQNLHYYVGVCAGCMARTGYDFEGSGKARKMNFLKTAEEAYLNAIQLEPRYARALYALGVLYTYGSEPGEVGLNEPEKAIPYLKRFLDIETKDTEGMLVLARAYYAESDYDNALLMCNKVLDISKSDERKAVALSFVNAIQDASNGL